MPKHPDHLRAVESEATPAHAPGPASEPASADVEQWTDLYFLKTKAVVAIKAVAHKLCRACYYIMRDRVAFDVTKAFGQK